MARKDGTADLRIKRTKKSIKEAFFNLVEERGFEHISVKDITDYAMLSRNTFYLHYKDKYDLLDKLCNELLRTLFFRVGKRLRRVQREGVSVESVATIISLGMYAVKEDRRYYKILFSDTSDKIFVDKISRIIRLSLDLAKDDIDGISESSLVYIVSGMTGFIRYYVMNNVDNLEEECLNFAKVHLGGIIELTSEKRNALRG